MKSEIASEQVREKLLRLVGVIDRIELLRQTTAMTITNDVVVIDGDKWPIDEQQLSDIKSILLRNEREAVVALASEIEQELPKLRI